MDLREYEAAKFELADVLRDLTATVPSAGDAPLSSLTELLARLAEDRFNLLVVGRFNRGKTSLMNALIGLDRLPTGILPLTSVITSVAYGSAERVQIEFEHGPFRYDIPMEALPEYITERGNPGNMRRIRRAHIELPAEILRRGFYFVDTPGLGSAILENTRTTEGFFPEADAVLCVSGYDAPLTEEEIRALRIFAQGNRPTFIVLNKHDMVSEPARTEILAYVTQQLQSIFPHTLPPVFSLSATDGLSARLTHDSAALEASGIAALERELTRFLTDDKGGAFILGVCERAIQLLDQLNPPQSRALRSRLENLRQRYILRIRERTGPSQAKENDRTPAERHSAPIARPADRMVHCVVCESVGGAIYDFLRGYQHELAESADARERLAVDGGLCARHLWLYASLARDRDICLALGPLLKRAIATLTDVERNATNGRLLHQSGRRTESVLGGICIVCKLQAQRESDFVRELAAGFTPDSSSHPGDRQAAVCLAHLRTIARGGAQMGRPQSEGHLWLQSLARRLAAAADRLTEDMQRYVLKRDAIRYGLATDEETQAAKQALTFLAGSRTFPPQP